MLVVQRARGTTTTNGATDRETEGQSWEARHVRATYWLDRGLRADVRTEAERRGWSVSQFVSWALQQALNKGH